MPLTSFSILMARQKGDLPALVQGVRQVDALRPGDRILLAEACTHNTSHEDIGQVKIPAALRKRCPDMACDFATGQDFPDDLSPYALVIHCGGCMMTRKAFRSRQRQATLQGVPFTNYGIFLAYVQGILQRCTDGLL